MHWLDLLAVQGTLKSLLQHHSSKASVLWRSAFFMVQLSHPYMSTGKTIVLTVWIFGSKVMYLLFNMLYRFVIAFLPRSKCLLISRLQSLSTVILETKKIKSVTVSIVSPSIYHEVMGLDTIIFIFWIPSCKPAFWAILIPAWASSSLAFCIMYSAYRASRLAQLVKNLPAMQETPIRFLGQEDAPGEGIVYPLQ